MIAVPRDSITPMPVLRRESVAGHHRGITLIELVVSCAILAMAMLGTTKLLMAVILNNRMTALEIAASTAIRNQVEEILTVSRDDPAGVGNPTGAVLRYFSTLPGAVVTANSITCSFPVPLPGVVSRDAAGNTIATQEGIGTAVFYLAETLVPAVGDNWSAEGANDYVWRDISANLSASAIAGNPNLRPVSRGFDMNLDDKISNFDKKGVRKYQDLSLSALSSSDFDLLQLPVDITVTYFSDQAHTRTDYAAKRRMVVTRDGVQLLAGFGLVP